MIALTRRPAAEVVMIVGLVLLIIWVIKPLGIPPLDLTMRVLVGVVILASPFIHGDSLTGSGFALTTSARH